MSTGFSGGCNCAAVRYECSSVPLFVGHCHCTSCRRDSGSGHATHLVMPAAAVRLTGEIRYWESRADSGNMVSRGFCPTCGVPVVNRNSAMPDKLFLRAGSMDDPNLAVPAMIVYASDAPQWDHMDPSLPSFPKMPPQMPDAVA